MAGKYDAHNLTKADFRLETGSLRQVIVISFIIGMLIGIAAAVVIMPRLRIDDRSKLISQLEELQQKYDVLHGRMEQASLNSDMEKATRLELQKQVDTLSKENNNISSELSFLKKAKQQ